MPPIFFTGFAAAVAPSCAGGGAKALRRRAGERGGNEEAARSTSELFRGGGAGERRGSPIDRAATANVARLRAACRVSAHRAKSSRVRADSTARRTKERSTMALTKKQLEARALACGASEIAALAGLSKWTSPIEIWKRKIEGESGASPSLAAELGDLLEDPIAKLAAKETGLTYLKVDTLAPESHPYAVATPDRAGFASREGLGDLRRKLRTAGELSGAVELLQVKHTTMRLRHEWGDFGTDGVPDYYYPQGVWECGCSLVARVRFAVLFDKHQFGTFPIDQDPGLFAGLYEIAERFFVDYVIPRKPPPADASDAYADWLARQFPVSSKDLITPSEAFEQKIIEWARLKAGEKRCKLLAKQLANELKAELGSNYGFAAPRFGKVLWIRNKQKQSTKWAKAFDELLQLFNTLANGGHEIDVAKLRETAAGIVAKYTNTVPGSTSLKLYAGESPLAKLPSQTLELDLEALEAGEEETEEEAA